MFKRKNPNFRLAKVIGDRTINLKPNLTYSIGKGNESEGQSPLIIVGLDLDFEDGFRSISNDRTFRETDKGVSRVYGANSGHFTLRLDDKDYNLEVSNISERGHVLQIDPHLHTGFNVEYNGSVILEDTTNYLFQLGTRLFSVGLFEDSPRRR